MTKGFYLIVKGLNKNSLPKEGCLIKEPIINYFTTTSLGSL
jgi:hypothetical protein